MTDRGGLDPRRSGLVVFDMLECHRPGIEEAGVIGPVRRLVEACRERGVPIFFARADHRPDGSDYNRSLTDTDASFRPWPEGAPQPDRFQHPESEMRVIRELRVDGGDYDLPKHRWSAFFQTPLELSLRSRDVDTLLLVGGSTHVGIAATAYAARDLDHHVVVVGDGCFGFEPQRSFFLERVFPRMARVRTVDQAVAMLDGGGSGAEPGPA
ncbi:MAG: cysteine hydrolase [Actinomycetota bacterium]